MPLGIFQHFERSEHHDCYIGRQWRFAATMRDKGLDPENDKPTRIDFVRRVSLALGDMQRKGKVEKVGRGRAMRWKLAGA
jgi:hypothetical protein